MALRRGVGAALTPLLLVVLAPGASALSDSGPHETVNLTSSTQLPATSAGMGYAARYHAAGDPDSDPPPLRRLVIRLPRGARIDTSVPPRCDATDSELMSAGESACPSEARVGSGEATIRQFGIIEATYKTVIYNADHDMLELVMSGGMVLAVVHTYIHGRRLVGPIPTCIGGGQPPDGCPSDQFALLANHLRVKPFSSGGRNYGTTPPSCPASRRWRARVTLRYADGSVDHVKPFTHCRPLRQNR